MPIQRSLVTAAILLLCGASSDAQNQAGKPCSVADLVGTWRVSSVNGASRPADHPLHKHVTRTHFAIIGWNPKDNNTVTRAHGGTYSVANGKYTEVIVYGFGAAYEALRAAGGRVEFSCRIDRDQWQIDGNIPGTELHFFETWVRVDSADVPAGR